MEYKDVFASLAVVLICVIGFLGWINFLNGEYGTSVGNEFNSTLSRVDLLSNLTALSTGASQNTIAENGAAPGDSQENFARRALGTLTLLPTMLGIVPDVLYEGSEIIGVSDTVVNIAVLVFMFAFALTFAYILILGIKQLL